MDHGNMHFKKKWVNYLKDGKFAMIKKLSEFVMF